MKKRINNFLEAHSGFKTVSRTLALVLLVVILFKIAKGTPSGREKYLFTLGWLGVVTSYVLLVMPSKMEADEYLDEDDNLVIDDTFDEKAARQAYQMYLVKLHKGLSGLFVLTLIIMEVVYQLGMTGLAADEHYADMVMGVIALAWCLGWLYFRPQQVGETKDE